MIVRCTPTTIPGGDPSRVHVREVGAVDGLRVTLSVQEEVHGTQGIVRGQGPPFVVGRREGRAVRVTDPVDLRSGFLPARLPPGEDSHTCRFFHHREDRVAVGVTGCGNVMTNPGVYAKTSKGEFGVVESVGPRGRPTWGEIRIFDGARGELQANDLRGWNLMKGAPPLGPDDWAVTGPLLVRNGHVARVDAPAFGDLRHVLLPGWVEVREGTRVDFGLDRLYADEVRLRSAVDGDPVEFALFERLPDDDEDDVDADLVEYAVEPAKLRAALNAKGYVEVDVLGGRGTYRIRDDRVEIAFLPGIYPHHALALDAEGRPWSVLVSGRSNREGVTIRDFARALVEAGARDAILLDNGGDVGLLLRENEHASWRYEIRPSEDDRAESWPLRACLIWHVAR